MLCAPALAACVLASAFIAEGMKIVAAGTNPVQLTRGMEKTVQQLVIKLKELSKVVGSDKDLADVASVSAGEHLGRRRGGGWVGAGRCCSLWGKLRPRPSAHAVLMGSQA